MFGSHSEHCEGTCVHIEKHEIVVVVVVVKPLGVHSVHSTWKDDTIFAEVHWSCLLEATGMTRLRLK